MTNDELRSALDRIGLSQGALARIFRLLGDTASPSTIRRRVESWVHGRARVPGEAAAFVAVLERFPDVLAALKAEASGAADP